MIRSTLASIDTLRAFDELQTAGLDETVARAVVDAINEAVTTTAVTADDLRSVEKRIGERIAMLDHKIDTLAADLDKKIELQGVELRTRNAQVLTETTKARADIAGRVSRLSRTLVVLFLLAAVLVMLRDGSVTELVRLVASAWP